MNIRIVGVNYMRNNPERFIESNTEDSWASYLANMSQQGTWADALVIQAIADAFHKTINIVESNQGFTPCTVISPVPIPGHEPTVINIGHYVSTIPYNQQMVEINVSCTSQFAQATGDETVVNTLSKQKERARKREWIRKKRASKEYRDKEKKATDNDKIGESQRQTFKKQKALNPTHVRELNKKVLFKTKQNNPERVRELKRQAFIRKKKENPNHTKKINNNGQKRKRDQSRQFYFHELFATKEVSNWIFYSMENISAIEDIITAHPADAFIRLQLDLCVSSIIFGYFKNLVTIAPNRLNCKDFTVFTFITRYTYR